MHRTLKAGKNWSELDSGVRFFYQSGEIRPEGELIEDIRRPVHWLLSSPTDMVGIAPYTVAESLYEFATPNNPIIVNPHTAVALYLDGGLSLAELERADEGNGYTAITVIRKKTNLIVIVSDGSGNGWVSEDGSYAFIPPTRPKARRPAVALNGPRWL